MASDPQAHDVQVRDLGIRVVEVGQGPPLLLVHGFLVSHREWEPVLPLLANDFRCIAVDLPGFGKSAKPSPEQFAYTRETYAELLGGLLDVLGVDKAHVCGHSMGGGIAMTLAADHPDRVDRLSVVDTVSYPFKPPLKGRLPLLPGIGSFIFKKLYGRTLFRDYFVNEVFSGKKDRVNFDRVDAYYDDFDAPGGRDAAYAALPQTVDVAGLGPKIGQVRAKTLVVWGDEDRIFPLPFGRRLAEDLPDGRLRIVTDSGHAPNEEHPQALADLLVAHHARTGTADLD